MAHSGPSLDTRNKRKRILAADAIIRSRQPAKPSDPQGNGAVVGSRLETIAGLTRAEYSQHPHITRGSSRPVSGFTS